MIFFTHEANRDMQILPSFSVILDRGSGKETIEQKRRN